MISNIQPCYCCRQCVGSNENFYIEVRNQSNKYINFILGYKINGKRVMKPSPPFARGKVERMVFPENAEVLCLRIFDSSFNPPVIICSRFPPSNRISRYKIITNPQGNLQCVDI